VIGRLIRSLRGSDKRAAQAPATQTSRPESDLREHGTTGTPIFAGFLRDPGEYNPALEGTAAFTIFEKMRRSDAQVAATLLGIKLPIRSAEWLIVGPPHPSPMEKEATEFVRSCLLEELDLDAVIENALLMLDFGCAAHEEVWYIDGNRVRLRKLSPRLPSTFNRWIMDGEELLAIEQRGPFGETAEVPISKLALFTFQQEGSNYAGRSILRPMYQHWYIKSNLYKIDAIAQERNGMGVPWIKMGPEAKREDREAGLAWLQKLSVHEKTALLLPPNWEFKLEGVTGTVRDAKDSIAHHNMAISMAGLAAFLTMGQSGNLEVGKTLLDFFFMGVQSTAKKIAHVLSWVTIARLVDYNFAGIERYPELVPQQIQAMDAQTLMTALRDLAASGMITPDPELEAWLRQRLGMPAKKER
jgi:phage gp29-like protein